jgi:pyruvate dehydrogenase E2 component (dihydrolipoamide acetyltransferase)
VPAVVPVEVPDIGDFKNVAVTDVLVKNGQAIEKDTPLITLETEKATIDVPSPAAGRVTEVKLQRGDKVSQGSVILILEATTPPVAAEKPPAASAAPAPPAPVAQVLAAKPEAAPAAPAPAVSPPPVDESAFARAYASPSVRKFARELGADLGRIAGTAAKGRVTHDDVKAFVKKLLSVPPPVVSALPKVPVVDYAAFGPVQTQPLTRIQKISGARLHASWVNLPHVTQYEKADISALEDMRASLRQKAIDAKVKLTPLAFIVKACVNALKEYPRFNASLDAAGDNLVLKNYFNVGFAADTPRGLVVPVIRDVERMDIFQIAAALAQLSEKARAGKLGLAEMQGGSFTISSLGGIGGTAFTPIINAPEVAILGVSKASFEPVYENGSFVPRLMLPLSLSYDHRVIDGADAARFVVFLAKTLRDVRSLL